MKFVDVLFHVGVWTDSVVALCAFLNKGSTEGTKPSI